MVKDDGEAGNSSKTLETPNPHGKPSKGNSDGPSLAGSGDTQFGKGMENGSRVSAGADDDIGVTLMELSGKRGGKRGTHQLKDGAKQTSKLGNGGEIDSKIMDMSGGGSTSILRRSKRNRVVVHPGEESEKLKKDEDGKEEEEEEDDDEEESEFAVGDFVWGKVKSHPWWPGRVFDPSEASEQALKYRHEGRILVAYFGDATFAWCDSSQLKPFVENFAEMSKQSSSKSFLNAVEEAVSEFARLVELDMTCYCTPRRNQSAALQQSAVNAGIKGGVNVNKGGLGMYSIDRFEPAVFLADLRLVGKHVSVANMLQMTTLKSQVSAIYRSKDGHLLLKINEQQEVEDDGDGGGAEDSFQGPVEESIAIMPGVSDGLVSSKRKERSVAEILYGNEKGNESQKKTGDEEAPKGKIDHGDEAEEVKQMGRRSNRVKMKESPRPIVVENNVADIEESEMSPRTRERKKSRYLCPPYTDLGYYRQIAVSSPRGPETKAVESSNGSQLIGSPSLVNCSGETLKKRVLKEDGTEHGKPSGSAPQMPKRRSNRKVVGDDTKSIASSDNVLSEIRSAALSGQVSKEDQTVKGFLTSYRSSKYQNGSKEINQESKSMKKSRAKLEEAELKNKVKELGSKTDGEVTGTSPPAALHLKFPPDYALPSKDDLGALYGKFGTLDTSKTQISQKSSSARVVFLRGSDAETACISSRASSPFGEAKVRYRIRHLRAVSGDKEANENGFKKKDSGSQKRTRSSKKETRLRLVKQKLEGMVTMVAEAGDGKMSKEMKLNLESNLKDLLEEVKALPALPKSSVSGV